MNRAKYLVASLTVGLGALCLLAGLSATDKKADRPGPLPRAEAPPPKADGSPQGGTDTKANSSSAAPRGEALAMGTAVKPKELNETVKKGLAWLVKQQHDNGGWGQGGGWRTSGQGSERVEGQHVKDPPDVGNTCFAVLALIRAGNTSKEGPYASNVARGVEFICAHVEKSDDKSLYVTDVRDTQLQSKIGPYVDTFLVSMVLSELKGKVPDAKYEKRMLASLNKTVDKMAKHQKSDGTFAGNIGWASVLSQGLANKGFARASQAGLAVPEMVIDRIQTQVAANYDPKAGSFRGSGGGLGGLGISSAGEVRTAAVAAPSPSDAGVGIYGGSSYLTNAADVSNTLRLAEQKARETLAKKDASKEEKEKAQVTLKEAAKNEALRIEATDGVIKQLDQPAFVQGFGSNGGEEFLSFMNISEALLLKGGKDWEKWDKAITESVSRVQDKDGSWSGHHCITGKTFCTAGALLALMGDRTPIPVAAK